MSDENFSSDDFTAASGDTSTASAVADVSAPVDDSAQPEAATIAPVETTAAPTAPAPTNAPGPIPFDVHKTALDNARSKAVAEWEQQYGWAKSVDRKAIEESQRLGQLYAQDRAGFVRQLLAESAADPTLAQVVRSEAARLLGHREPASPSADLTPIQVQLENGQTLGLYSADQIAALQAQWTQDMEQKLAPALATTKQLQEATQHYQMAQDAQRFAQGFGSDLGKLPLFAEHKDEIRARLASVRLETDHPAEVKAATLALYNEIVLPKLQTARQMAQVQTINQKVGASTHVPGQTQANPPTSLKDMSWDDAFAHEYDRVIGAG